MKNSELNLPCLSQKVALLRISVGLLVAFALSIGMIDAKAQGCGGCNGPVSHSGSSSGSCSGTVASGGCAGPIISIAPYYSCGGTTTEYCETTSQSIGTSTPCVQTFDSTAYNAAVVLWDACIVVAQNKLDCGPAPTKNAYTDCSAGTATSITGAVYSGSSGTCNLAMREDEQPNPKLIFLAATLQWNTKTLSEVTHMPHINIAGISSNARDRLASL